MKSKTAGEYAVRLAARYPDRLVILTGVDASSPVEVVGADGASYLTPLQFADASCSRRRLAKMVTGWLRSEGGDAALQVIVVTGVGGASAYRR